MSHLFPPSNLNYIILSLILALIDLIFLGKETCVITTTNLLKIWT